MPSAGIAAGALICLSACTASPVDVVVPSSSAVPTPAAAWSTFTTADGLASWQLPEDWTVLPPRTDAQGQVDYEVLDAEGASRLYYSHKIWGLGGPGCVPGSMETYPYERLDEVPMSIPPDQISGAVPTVAFEVLDAGDHVIAGLGTTTSQIADAETCEDSLSHIVFEGGDVGAVSFSAHSEDGPTALVIDFPSPDAAQAYLETPEYRTIVRIISSLSFDPASATGPRATAAPVAATPETSPVPDGGYEIQTHAECGTFPLNGQTLSVSGGDASVTTPGQVLHGSLSRISRAWEVNVVADDGNTTVVLDGNVLDGYFRGAGEYSGIFPGGDVGWTCPVDDFVVVPLGGPISSGDISCSAEQLDAARALFGGAEIDREFRYCAGDWMALVVRGSVDAVAVHRVDGVWRQEDVDAICAPQYFPSSDPAIGPWPEDTYTGPLDPLLVSMVCIGH